MIQGPIDVASMEVITANNNNFTGNWIVKAGYLKGSAVGALGVGNIIIDPNYSVPSTLVSPAAVLNAGPARFEVTYDHATGGTLTLANGAIMILHQNVTFGGVTINGTALSNGVILTQNFSQIFQLISQAAVRKDHGRATQSAARPDGPRGNGWRHAREALLVPGSDGQQLLGASWRR